MSTRTSTAPQIRQLQGILLKQEIFGLDVAVENSVSVHVIQRTQQTPHERLHFLLRDVVPVIGIGIGIVKLEKLKLRLLEVVEVDVAIASINPIASKSNCEGRDSIRYLLPRISSYKFMSINSKTSANRPVGSS